MNRRSFLGVFGAASASVKSVAAKVIESTSVLDLERIGVGTPFTGAYGISSSDTTKSGIEKAGTIQKLRAFLANEASIRAREMKRIKNGVGHDVLSPNIHALRSVSLSYKIAMQNADIIEKRIAARKEYAQNRINKLLGLGDDDWDIYDDE